ncbi:Protein JBTS17 [Holothuria leucospilota]|uniref:Protein JBTS17 n=1 Tax=Holothuria leucospilota TaxID=206669 RepID=A0A9Q1C8F0_HOLLE|nr:Protein JBTS17 [Holothuria leucospilota]
MRLDLKVVHTPDTKSKKPWKKIHWLGSQSDILLKAYCRLKVLHLQDKNLKKKKISKLQSILKKLCICNISQNGNYVVGIIDTGGIIIWSHLDDTTRTVNGPAALVEYFEGKQQQQGEFQASHKTKVFISNDARNILVVVNLNRIFLWQASQHNIQNNAKEIDKEGDWYTVARSNTPLPPSHSVDACVDSMFFQDSILGKCNICSFVFYKGSYLQVSSVLIKWLEPWKRFTGSSSFFNVSWHSLTIPVDIISPGCQPLHQDGALVTSHSTNGLLLAVAVNQDSPSRNRVLFLSVLSHSMVNVDLKSCGCKSTEPNKEVARTYWVEDCSWNHDNLFLACIMKKGSIFLLSRLGDLLEIQTDGCSVEHGPDLFIPLHPLISVIPSKHSTEGKQVTGDTPQDVNLQNFSVTFHPSLPLLVCSDGFLATVMELPSMISCAGLIREFLGEGKSAINYLCEQFLPKVKQLPTLGMEVKRSAPLHLNDTKEASMSKFLSTDSSGLEFGYAGPFARLTEGKIIFGSPHSPNSTIQDESSGPAVQHISRRAERMLLLAWLCGSSQYTEWDPQLETLLVFTAKCLAKFCLATSRLHQREENVPLMPVDTFQKSISILSWDLTHVHILCSAVKFVHQTVVNVLAAKPALTVSSLTHSVALLMDCEAKLHHIYSLGGLTTGSFMPDENMWHIGDEVGSYQTYDSFSDLQRQCLGGNREAGTEGSQPLEGEGKKIGSQDVISRSVLPTWKVLYQKTIILYSALNEHVKTSRRTEQLFLHRIRRFLVNLLGVLQRKLCSAGCHVSLHVHQFWAAFLDETYLRGCEKFMMGDLLGATRCWQATYETSRRQEHQLGKSPTQDCHSHHQLQEKCLLAILYSSLISYNISQALELANSIIESVSVDAKKLKVKRSFKQLLEVRIVILFSLNLWLNNAELCGFFF